MSELILELPKERQKPESTEVNKLMIVGTYKLGKTSLVSQLPSCLIIDVEQSTKGQECMSFDVVKLAIQQGIPKYQVLGLISQELKKDLKNTGRPKYDFIAIDSTTALEDCANELAIKRYKETPMGKSWQGGIITNLPNGAGEGHLREAFNDLYHLFDGCYNKSLILVGHVKKASISKNGEQMDARDVDLRGKNKSITLADMDATGFLRREKDTNKNYISFKTAENDLVTGSRFDYLSGKEFLISEKKDGKIISYWENIFPSLRK